MLDRKTTKQLKIHILHNSVTQKWILKLMKANSLIRMISLQEFYSSSEYLLAVSYIDLINLNFGET